LTTCLLASDGACCSVLQCVAVCCSVLQVLQCVAGVAVFCRCCIVLQLLQCFAVAYPADALRLRTVLDGMCVCVCVRESVLGANNVHHCVYVCTHMFAYCMGWSRYVYVSMSVLQCVAVCCSVL